MNIIDISKIGGIPKKATAVKHDGYLVAFTFFEYTGKELLEDDIYDLPEYCIDIVNKEVQETDLYLEHVRDDRTYILFNVEPLQKVLIENWSDCCDDAYDEYLDDMEVDLNTVKYDSYLRKREE